MEMLSRVKAVLRRSHVKLEKTSHQLQADALVVDLDRRSVMFHDQEISLTYKEFELLTYLMRNRGTAISRDRPA